MLYSEKYYSIFDRYGERFDRVVKNKSYMIRLSPLIAIGLLLISIGIVVTFDIKIDLLKK